MNKNGCGHITPHEKVLVVGGGPVGATLALALAQNGVPVTLCDAAPASAPPTDGRAYAFSLSSRRIMEMLGLWSDLRDQAQPINDILVTDGKVGAHTSPLRLHFSHHELAVGFAENMPCGHMIEDRLLRPTLIKHVKNTPLIEFVAPAFVENVRVESGLAHAQLADGSSLSAALIVACDGHDSVIARGSNFDKVGWSYKQDALVTTIQHEKPHHSWAYEHFLPSGPFAILPLCGKRSSIVWIERPAIAEAIIAQGEEFFMRELGKRFGSFLGELHQEGTYWRFPLSLSLSESMVSHRLALAGDAAHIINPIAGQGLNIGMRDVAALAEIIVNGKRRGEDLGSLQLLERYQSWRRPDIMTMALATDGLNRLFSNDIAPIRLMRDIGMELVGHIGFARRFFLKYAAGVIGDIPRLARGEAL